MVTKTKQYLSQWVNTRFPLREMWQTHMSKYYAPKNFNFWYFFGGFAMLVFVSQIVSGIWLTMYYMPTAKDAFSSVEYIMRDVNFGWLIRYMHTTGASAFFIVVYLHMFRSLLYGSHKRPRELVWLIGMAMYFLLMAEAFMGYLLPWGQMSYWAAQVITSLFTAIPYVGDNLTLWLRGDYNITGVTLNRYFALHVIAVPFLLAFLVWMHIIALHQVGSNNPDGIDIKKRKDAKDVPLDGVPFHPYYTVKDLMGAAIFLLLFAAVLFFAPEMGGYFIEHANFQVADPLQTPGLIAPVWYMTPFYTMLRSVPDKLLGVIVMGSSIFILSLLPWLDRSPVRSLRYRGWYSRMALFFFVISFIALGYLGTIPVTPMRLLWARIFTMVYFAFFILMPFYTRYEKTKPLPEQVS